MGPVAESKVYDVTDYTFYFDSHHYEFNYHHLAKQPRDSKLLLEDQNILITISNLSSLLFVINDNIQLNYWNDKDFHQMSHINQLDQAPSNKRRRILHEVKEQNPQIISAEASGKTIEIICDSRIHIESAIYGSNCNGDGSDQTQKLRQACDNKRSCLYKIDDHIIGDPAPGCAKAYNYKYSCQESKDAMKKQKKKRKKKKKKRRETDSDSDEKEKSMISRLERQSSENGNDKTEKIENVHDKTGKKMKLKQKIDKTKQEIKQIEHEEKMRQNNEIERVKKKKSSDENENDKKEKIENKEDKVDIVNNKKRKKEVNMKQNIDKIESEDKREERQELKPMHGSQNTEMDSSKEKTLQRKIDKTKEKMREAKQKEPKSPIEIGMMQNMNNLKLQNKKMELKEKEMRLKQKQKHLMHKKQTIQTTNEQRMKKQRDRISKQYKQSLLEHQELMKHLKAFFIKLGHLVKQAMSQKMAPTQLPPPQYFTNPNTPKFPQNYPLSPAAIPLLVPPIPPIPPRSHRSLLDEQKGTVSKCLFDEEFGKLCIEYDNDHDIVSFDIMTPKYKTLKGSDDRNILAVSRDDMNDTVMIDAVKDFLGFNIWKYERMDYQNIANDDEQKQDVVEYGQFDDFGKYTHSFVVYQYDIELDSDNVTCGNRESVPFGICLRMNKSNDVFVYFVDTNELNVYAESKRLNEYMPEFAQSAINWKDDAQWDEIFHFQSKDQMKKCTNLGLAALCMQQRY